MEYESLTSLAVAYLNEFGGSSDDFNAYYLQEHQRWGQAFFNALSREDKVKIVGTMFDPFHKNGLPAVEAAIEFLLYH